MATCKGRKRDGTPCRSPIVLDNGYCHAHQDQAPEAKAPEEPVRWTRECLEAAIAAHGGPEGLDLAGADLSNLNLIDMDLHGIVLGRSDAESRTEIVTNLKRTLLLCANLQEASMRHVNLREANLARADLQQAYLQGASLQGANLGYANLKEADLWEANLQGVNLGYASLQGANLKRADLQGAILGGANLQEVNLEGANLQEAYLWDASLQGAHLRFVDLREFDLLDIRSLQAIKLYRAKLDHTALKREQLGPAIGEELAGAYREARDAYLALKQNFEGLGDYEAASWSYIKERQMEKACSAPWRARWFYGEEQLGDATRPLDDEGMSVHNLPAYHPQVWWFFVRHTAKWLSDWLVELVCGYGERPWRTVATMAVVFAVFVGIYWATWAVMKVEETPKAIVRVPTRNLIDLAVFGLGAFTTMDPKGLDPRATWVQFVAGLEALLGIGLTGLLGFVLGNRIRRS